MGALRVDYKEQRSEISTIRVNSREPGLIDGTSQIVLEKVKSELGTVWVDSGKHRSEMDQYGSVFQSTGPPMRQTTRIWRNRDC